MILKGLPSFVRLIEVGPRDGLQNEGRLVPTPSKIAFVDALSAAGISEIEVTSFVSPRWVPQLSDSEQVARGITRRPGIIYAALVPNLRGLERALASGIGRLAVFTAASETFNLHNVNASIRQSIERFRPVVREARAQGLSIRGYVSTAFVCPYEGPVPPEKTVEVVERLSELGIEEISIGDTIGAAVPEQIDRLLDHLEARFSKGVLDRIALHLHDTRGTALANVLLALQRGVRTFDTSAGGLGGCPFAVGASGNLATEDMIYLLDGLGIKTGIDHAALTLASNLIEEAVGHPLPSRVRKAEAASRPHARVDAQPHQPGGR